MKRRAFLRVLGVGMTAVVVGCGDEPPGATSATDSGGPDGEAADGSPPGVDAGKDGSSGPDGSVSTGWSVPVLTFVAGSGGVFDLKTTLPQGAPSGGTFSVDPSGAPLPNGMTLSSNGVLSVGGAVVGDTNGVVFAYVA